MEYVLPYGRLRDKEQALSWFAEAVSERNRVALEFKVDPRFDAVRDDPRFGKIIASLEL
jgi:hypothetical protein